MSHEQLLTRAYSRRDVIRLLGRAAIAVPAAGAVGALANPAQALAASKPRPSSSQLNVKNYGAKGDGVSDDTAAIAQALAAVRATANAVVYFPAGTYLVSKALALIGPVAVSGASAATTRLRLTADWGLFYASNTAQVKLSNLTLDANNLPGSYGMWINDASNVTIANCQFVNVANCGVSLQRVSSVWVTSSTFKNIGWSGVRLEDPGDGNANRYVYVQGCAFSNVVASGLAGHAAVQAHDNPAAVNERLWIQNNAIQSRGVGLGLDSMNYGTVSGNRIVGNGVMGEGIAFSGANNLLSGNTINNNFAAGILQWAVAYRSNAGNTIAGNTCYDNAQGIAVVCAADGTLVKDLTIASNRCYSASTGHPQQWGVQAYINGASSFQWVNVRIASNDLRGNAIGGVNLVPPATAALVNNQA